jgi:hypothetical protein
MQLNLFGFENFKRCKYCKKVLSLNFFYKNKRRVNSFSSYCNNCSRLIIKNWEIKNKDKCKEKWRKWYQNNKEKKIEQNKEWKKNNYEKYLKIQRNSEGKRLKNDPLFKLSKNARTRIWQAFKNKGYKKHTKTEKILGTDWNTLKKHIENQFTDNMSWDNFDKIHIDHKIPLAAASTEFEVTALNHYTNLQPMWAEDNIRKSDKYNPEDFKRYMDWYKINIFKTIYLNK